MAVEAEKAGGASAGRRVRVPTWPTWGPPLLLYGAVVLAAWLFNRGYGWAGGAFLLACLGLPWLEATTRGQQAALASTLTWRRDGWGAVAWLALAALLVRWGALAAAGFVPAVLLGYAQAHAGDLADHLAVVAILAVAEEFFFRGYLQGSVGERLWGARHWGPLTAANLAAAVLFAAAHLVDRPAATLPLLMLGGLGLGWLFERSQRSIWPAALLHLVGNVLAG